MGHVPTLTVRKGSKGLGWIVREGDVVRATARMPILPSRLEIDLDSRHLSARGRLTKFREFTLVDDTEGSPLLDGRLTAGAGRTPVHREWALAFRDGRAMTWICHRPEPRYIGIVDGDGVSLMQMGHDVSFDAPAKATLFRVLLSFWAGALKSQSRYVLRFEDVAVGRAVAADELPVLSLIGTWLLVDFQADWAGDGPS